MVENIITKLFDTLKNSIDKSENTLDKAIDVQINNMVYLKSKIEKIEETNEKNSGLLNVMFKKINTMILVVVISFTLMTSAYFIARSFNDIVLNQQTITRKK